MAEPIRFKGLRELDRALGKADKTLHKGLRDKFREAGDIVAREAKQIAESKGLRVSGDLINGIRPFAQASRAGVRSGATHAGYAYPKRLEYEGRMGRRYGQRASLGPALDAKEREVYDLMEHLLDDIANEFGGSPL